MTTGIASSDRAALRPLVDEVLGLHLGAGTEVMLMRSTTGLTRFAGSQVTQNTVRSDARAYIRVSLGDRAASATTNRLDRDGLENAARAALAAAKVAPVDPEFPGLPVAAEVGSAEAFRRWDEATAAASADERAAAVERIVAAAGDAAAAGIYETSSHDFAIFSTEGIDASDGYTRCNTICLATRDDASGWGEASSHARDALDEETVARTALAKARAGEGATGAEPGVYPVVLEPAAVAMLLEYLAYTGFGAKQMIDGESFFSSRKGQRVAARPITIRDDAAHPLSVGIAFDFEGVPRRPVAVIEDGVAVAPVTDLRTARILDADLTGHFSGSNEFGPYASNVVLDPGTATQEDMVAAISDGFLVTRFHYVNVLDRPETLLTGMTRDGTFRIRNGEIAEPVTNFRFSHSVLGALSSVTAIGRDPVAFAPEYGSFGSTVAPALAVGEFNFTSRTTH